MRVDEIRGVGTAVVEKLNALGIKTDEDLLKAGKTPAWIQWSNCQSACRKIFLPSLSSRQKKATHCAPPPSLR